MIPADWTHPLLSNNNTTPERMTPADAGLIIATVLALLCLRRRRCGKGARP